MVKFCLAKALECRRGAERATDPSRRQSWLEMEGMWFYLARSYDNERRPRAFRENEQRRWGWPAVSSRRRRACVVKTPLADQVRDSTRFGGT